MATWKKVVVSGSNAELNTLRATSVTASLFGTSSYAIDALNAISASYAVTASYVIGASATSSYAITASYAENANTANSATTATSASYATNASSSNYAQTALSSSRAESAGTVDSISGNITNNADNRVITANGDGTINAEENLTFDGDTLSLTGTQNISGNLTVTGDLTVDGTTTFINTQNLFVEDRFILLASGSATATDGGIVISAAANGNGYGIGYDASADRWALEDAMNPTGSAFSATPTAYMVTAESSTAAPSTDPSYGGSSTGWGNIHVDTNTGEIYIYS